MATKPPRKWIIAERMSKDLLDHLLLLRGVADVNAFLQPQFGALNDPFLLPDMKRAVERIERAIKNREQIGLYGDYDCDGIPGTALLWRAFQALGAVPVVYIPKREVGYGLSREGVDWMHERGVKVLITIDNGTTALEEVGYAREKGIEVIVTDHHQPHANVPDCLLINPKLVESGYPFTELCGTAVVYKLIEALARNHPNVLTEGWLKWQLDLVALATVCDLVELTSENRILTKYGLTVMQKTRNVGLQALIKVTGVNPDMLTAGTLGYTIGPRINVAGRMEGDPQVAFELLITEDAQRAEAIAHSLHRLNLQRQELVNQAIGAAEQALEQSGQLKSAAIVLEHPAWTPGILGLIASKLLERYHKPTFIFDAKSGKGSARSIEGFPLPAAMEHVSQYFSSYGGHAMAAGMAVKKGEFLNLQKALVVLATEQLGSEERVPHLHIDAEVALADVHPGLTKKLSALEPHGVGNARPLFVVKDVQLDGAKFIGTGNKHLRGTVNQKGSKVSFVAFGAGERMQEFQTDTPVSLAGRIEENYWNGRTSAELHVVDIDRNSSI